MLVPFLLKSSIYMPKSRRAHVAVFLRSVSCMFSDTYQAHEVLRAVLPELRNERAEPIFLR